METHCSRNILKKIARIKRFVRISLKENVGTGSLILTEPVITIISTGVRKDRYNDETFDFDFVDCDGRVGVSDLPQWV